MTSKILIISPALNEFQILPIFVTEFLKLRQSLSSKSELRLLIVNDGSTDKTGDLLLEFSAKYPDVIGFLSFPSNFGHQQALLAGLLNIGQWPQAVITMDCDLEHPMELVGEMVSLWKSEKLVMVNTIRETHGELGFFKRFFSKLFYKTTAYLTGLELLPGQADYRLWDAQILRAVSAYLPNVGSLRVFSAWLPGKKRSLTYQQKVQPGRISRFTFGKNLEVWKAGIVRFSNFPLKVIAFAGYIGLAFSVLFACYIFYIYLKGVAVPGWSSTIMVVLVLGCIQLISIGMIASYLNRIVFARDLPRFVIHEKSQSWE